MTSCHVQADDQRHSRVGAAAAADDRQPRTRRRSDKAEIEAFDELLLSVRHRDHRGHRDRNPSSCRCRRQPKPDRTWSSETPITFSEPESERAPEANPKSARWRQIHWDTLLAAFAMLLLACIALWMFKTLRAYFTQAKPRGTLLSLVLRAFKRMRGK